MKSAFRKISRVSSLTGGTKWYLSDDCLLAAKRVMYAVEYRRFYLHDLESIVVWPSRTWVWRLTVPGLLLISPLQRFVTSSNPPPPLAQLPSFYVAFFRDGLGAAGATPGDRPTETVPVRLSA